jgi:hypothetical protein
VRYWVCVLAGVVLFAGSVYAFSHALTELLETGTCASGNTPYVVAKQCPDGTGSNILTLMGSIFGLLAAAAVFAFRGERPGGGKGRGASPLVAGWAIFFSVTGAVSLLHALSSDSIPSDGKLGGIIVGVTFLLMGLPALVYWIWTLVSDPWGRDERPAGFAAATGFSAPAPSAFDSDPAPAPFTVAAPGGGDRIAELERLERLRQSGALTEAEFEREKKRVLGR